MPTLSLITLYLSIPSKSFVNNGGTPTSVPDQFYGDMPMFAIYPVQPNSSNPSNPNYQPVNLAGYTMNLTMAAAPNAASPPTPFASLDGMTWDGVNNRFLGAVDLTQPAVGTYIGNASGKIGYFNLDLFDSTLKRTTVYQEQFNMNASIDAVAAGPPGNPIQYITVAQALNLFVQIAGIQGKFINFISADGTKKKTLTLGNDGTEQWNTYV